MKKCSVTALLLAAVLLTGCGDNRIPEADAAMTAPAATDVLTETTAVTGITEEATYDLCMTFGPYLSGYISDQDAAAIVSEIRAQEEIPLPDSDRSAEDYYEQAGQFLQSYAVNMILNDILTDTDLGLSFLELHDRDGWIFLNKDKFYKAPEELRQRVCKMQFAYAKEDPRHYDDEPFADNGFILETCDVPEGSYFFTFHFQNGVNLTRAGAKLTDSSGMEIPMLVVGEGPEYQKGVMRELDILTDTLLRQGTYTLSIGGLSADFSVIPAQDFVDAEKQRLQAEKAQKQAERNP